MTTHSERETLMRYVLGWLGTDEAAAVEASLDAFPEDRGLLASFSEFLQGLQDVWLRQQSQGWADSMRILEERLDQITLWVTGDLSNEEIQSAQQVLNSDPRCRTLYGLLSDVATRLEQAERLDLRAILQRLRQTWASGEPGTPSALQPAAAWRGQRRQPLVLDVPPEYGFYIKLFVGGFDTTHRVVKGVVQASNGESIPAELIKASVWLLPEAGHRVHSASLNARGEFKMDAVLPETYVLEMAWAGKFLEILDVAIPAAV